MESLPSVPKSISGTMHVLQQRDTGPNEPPQETAPQRLFSI